MTTLDADALLAMVTQSYFANVDQKKLAPVLACFHPDATLTVQTDNLTHTGRDQGIARMFTDFFAAFPIIWHGDFEPVVDVGRQRVAVRFNALRGRSDGGEERAKNVNYFVFKDGKFQNVTIWMSDENPLR